MVWTFRTQALFAADLPAITMRGPTYRWHFADMASLPLYDTKPARAWDDTAWNSERQRGVSMTEACQLARLGWPEGAQTARALHEGVMASLPEKRRLGRYGVAGAVPSIPRALAGNPAHMRQLVMRESAQKPILTLVCDVLAPWAFPAADMIRHAAAVAGVVDFLEEHDFRCEVLAASRFDGRVNAEIVVRMKAAEQPLNLAQLAFGLGHPSFVRRHLFAILQADPDLQPLGGGLGNVEYIRSAPELGTFTIDSAARLGRDRDAPSRFWRMLASLRAQGCPGIPEHAQAA